MDSSEEVLARLRRHRVAKSRYLEKGEIGRGGMGAILRIWDQDLRRNLAMKVILGGEGGTASGTADVPPKVLARFLEEAQVTAQLDHPGIVPVHELGLDEGGGVYFTMRLVKGTDLEHILALVRNGDEGWTRTRALSVMLKVCEALAYAHSKGVMHRDLKPANIMVGRFGEVYVMDWGLARVMGRPDLYDMRLDDSALSLSIVDSDRSEGKPSMESPLYTMAGDVFGTPAYMSPEQARGDLDVLGPCSDVYSIGAMLYHLLGGQAPYCPAGAKLSQLTILRWLLDGPPKPLHGLKPELPDELTAICEKAMRREISERYEDMAALADDLRAYLEGRVVAAHHTGAMAQLRKWIARNRALAAACLVALFLALGGLGAVGYVQKRGRDQERALREVAEANEAQARAQETLAEEQRAKVLRLSAFQNLEDLQAEADTLWPATPERVDAYGDWLARAQSLVTALHSEPDGAPGGHYGTLAELRARALSAPVDSVVEAPGPVRFADDDDAWWFGQLTKLIESIEAFADPEAGLIQGVSEEWGWSIGRRLEYARTIAADSLSDDGAREVWAEAIASIANEVECPEYRGLKLVPQLGLLPIGRDPSSGLWEFAHLETGDPALRDARGRLQMTEATGLIFVLLPGGRFRMGAQRVSEGDYNYDRATQQIEGPVQLVALSPFFLSKYEMTQGQWVRFTGKNPSRYAPGTEGFLVELTHPVEQISWIRATQVLRRMSLRLPTEAQWEYGCRGGTESPWWTGDRAEALAGVGNFADRFAHEHGASWSPYDDWLDDGNLIHAPVGSYEPNAYGLLDTHGNVWEWCRDPFGSYKLGVLPGTGERLAEGEERETSVRVVRGGAFNTHSSTARSAGRQTASPELTVMSMGIRPVLELQ